MMKRYKIGDDYYWYHEGDQPDCAILVEAKKEAKAEVIQEAEVETKSSTPKNKGKGVKNK